MDLEEFNRLQRRVSDLEAKQERLRGAREQLLRELEESFDCKSIEEAEKLIAKTKRQIENDVKKCENLKTEFQELWEKQKNNE